MKLGEKFDLKAMQEAARQAWDAADPKEISASRTAGQIAFIEGPPTMNGVPHAGHLRGRVMKDLWYRHMTLRGYDVLFNGGWDTQGLPVELQAEKELGISGGRSEIERTGSIEKVVQACKELVSKYNKSWVEVDSLLGMSMGQDGAYWTMRDGYIEREWQVLRRANEDGILQDDHTVIAYCPGCQTSLSHAEVNQGYEEVKDPSLYYKVRLEGGEFAIVWTTMPFTLVTDAMIGFNPDEEYKKVRVDKETWVIGSTRCEELLKEAGIEQYEVTGSAKGSEFEGTRYAHPLLAEIPALKELAADKYHTAVSEEFVDASTGSGIVHLSPANGEEDIKIASKRSVPVFCPIDDEGKFTADAGKYSGAFVRDADRAVVDDLRACGALVRIGRIKHKYPLCWRSRHPIIWLARRGWFYKLDRLGDRAVEAAGAVEYYYEQPKNRFLGIIGERHPWCISRERFWGCPLPVWNCADCKNRDWLYSRKEIISAASDLPDGEGFELHRPWIDRVKVRCSKCGSSNTSREPYVLDTWHNSGAAPFASLTEDKYRDAIPAPFFTEGIDQTRGWAYTLLVENVILSGKAQAPYKSFLFQGHVLDEKGGKMSKSLGNVIDAKELLTSSPADLVRFYFMWKSSPIEPLSFSKKEMDSRPRQVLSTLYNLHTYYQNNSSFDKFDPGQWTVQRALDDGLLALPDKWALSKLQELIKRVGDLYQSCRYHEAARAIEDYAINLFSQAYVPMTRGELWNEGAENKPRRLAIYAVLGHILRTVDVLLHPICPYTTECMYQAAGGSKPRILLESWPEPDERLRDLALEEAFGVLRQAESISAAARMKGALKRRWPLSLAHVCVRPGQKAMLEGLGGLLAGQLNVESVKIYECSQDSGSKLYMEMKKMQLPVAARAELDRKSAGPKARQHLPELGEKFAAADPEEVALSLAESGAYEVVAGGSAIALDEEDVAISVGASGGHCAASRDGTTVIMSSERSKEMAARGLLKDIARRMQSLRKKSGFNPTDVLGRACISGLDPDQEAAIRERAEELAHLVRVKEVTVGGPCEGGIDEEIDGQKIRIAIG